jgi:hypothetical protein
MDLQNGYEEKPTVELLPPLSGRCMLLVRALHGLFLLVPVLVGLWAWLEFGWLYGLLIWLSAVFAATIVLSKLKLAYIPFDQHELSHSTAAILKWVVFKRFC